MCFHGLRNAPPSGSQVTVGGATIGVERAMKYLGLVLDGRWSFVEHFRRLGPKLEKAGAAFKRLLPNLGGPNAPCRKLYAGVMRSMALYGAPVLTGHGCFGRYLHRIGREEAPGCHHCADSPEDTVDHTVQVCAAWEGHRRVLVEALGGGDLSRPALIQAMVRGEREWDAVASFCEAVMLEKEETERQRVRTSHPGRRAGPVTTQVLTGHGCFGRYLHRISREVVPGCHHCADSPEDTVDHTVQEYPAWQGHRRVLVEALGGAATSRVRALFSSWSGARGSGMSPLCAKQSCSRRRWRNDKEFAPLIAATALDQVDTTGAGCREVTPGRRRRGSLGGELGWLIVPPNRPQYEDTSKGVSSSQDVTTVTSHSTSSVGIVAGCEPPPTQPPAALSP
ncbi:hypothetical protein B5X24_HaOG216255, partial [Helicoverpa armigera]